MNCSSQDQHVEHDTGIDLREIVRLVIKRRWMMALTIAIVTIIGVVYAYTAKPLYSGGVLLEIGEVVIHSDNSLRYFESVRFDDPDDLSSIIARVSPVSVKVPRGSKTLVSLSYSHQNREVIRQKLEEAVTYILERHRAKAELYKTSDSQVRMTYQIGGIGVGKKPVKPKKTFVVTVAFVGGVALSLFLVLFMELVAGSRSSAISRS